MAPTLPRDLPFTESTSPNYFTSSEVAARYTEARPFYQDEVAARLLSFSAGLRFRRALDVGCGSGQSSLALAAIADQIIAIDASQGMLDHAIPHPNISYRLGVAEQLNFTPQEFDLVSVGSALHWFDQDRFFAQCQNVLAPAGVLAVYNDHFTAHLQDVIACKRWMRTRFAKRFPPPRRGMRDLAEAKTLAAGFTIAHRSSFSHLVPFSRDGFIAYLLTRSNTLAAIHSGKETASTIVDWLRDELAEIIPTGVTGSFIFKCNLWFMHKTPAPDTCL